MHRDGGSVEYAYRYPSPSGTTQTADALSLIHLSEGATKGRKDEDASCNSGDGSPAYQRRHRFSPENKLLREAGFGAVEVQTVVQTIEFPSVVDYVRFQLVATPMTVLLQDKIEPERQAIISSVASKVATLSAPAMLDGGKFTFPQEAYVAVAWASHDVG